MKLQGHTCLLTGASGGIGQAIAKELSKQGVCLILVGRNLPRLEQLQ
jgi:short-subunit dehydrogenase